MLVVAVLATGSLTRAQIQTTGTPVRPARPTTIDGKQLPPPDPTFGGVIKEKATESKPWWPPTRRSAQERAQRAAHHDRRLRVRRAKYVRRRRPDAGAGSHRQGGLRYTQFHSTSLCSPTRAALITGRNHHLAGFGVVGEAATGFPGYDSVIERNCGTIGEILKQNGYATSWFGKDHNTPVLSSEPGRAIRSMADRHGLRLFLRVHRRRHQPVAAEPVPQYDGHLSVSRASPAGI